MPARPGTSATVYDLPKGRPVWKVLPVRVGVTVALMVLALLSALIVVFTGGLARQTGAALGIAGGHPEQKEPYVEPRDTRKWDEQHKQQLKNEG